MRTHAGAAAAAAVEKAAMLVITSRDDLTYGRRRQTRSSSAKPVSIRQAAAIFNVPSSTVQKAVQRALGRRSSAGRPRLLSDDEDDAVAAYVTWLQRSGFPATRQQVQAVALTLLQRRDPNARAPGRHWYNAWIDAHPELRVTTIKAVERARKTFEASDVCYIEAFFQRLEDIVNHEGTFYTSVSLADIRQSQESSQRLAAQKSHRQELRQLKAMVRREREQLLEQYRNEKFQVINGKARRLTIKQWLAWGKSDDYLALETSEEMYARLLKPADKFTIDTTRTPLCAPWREGRRTIVIAATYGALAVIVAAGHAYATRARLEET
ncbi:uncharacterized protein HRG_11220 [Hirsutella rhossiliensis]|uniref:HTH psq-type domain-containing protein n=1 Tax=Hirsutella rhossiliensis TaxID=111463 RepID=A0A9P8MMG8_9HYPO|nr:uncharacterized protein HRG_11220 [Hirsutella rhossiliensis]KAH0957729.1 hypothetical protein HRG_11220 [Hirsutella rhossiliensis]